MRPPFSDFREFYVQKIPLFSNIMDMRNIPSKTPFSANFRMLMRTIYLTECGDRAYSTRQTRLHSVPNALGLQGFALGLRGFLDTVYSGYSGHVYSGHSDIVATFPGTKSIYSIIFRSDIVANRI